MSTSVSELGAGAGDQLRSAPATSGAFAELQILKKSRKELDWAGKNGPLRSSSATAELLIEKKFTIVAYTRTDFLIVCDFCYSASG